MVIIKPDSPYFEEYYKACKESYDNNITEWMPFDLSNYDYWKKNILTILDNYETGKDIPEGMPRTYTYWCVDNDNFIGEIQLRPFLTEDEAKKWGHISYAVRYSRWNQGFGTKILQESIIKAYELNVKEVYVACRENNIGSIKVIEKNGGKFIATVLDEENERNYVYNIPR